MLKLIIPESDAWDPIKEEFVHTKGATLQLEHSLVSLSKWEAEHHKPLLTKEDRTPEEMIDYIRAMTITQNVNPAVYSGVTNENLKQVVDYISDSMTASWITNNEKPASVSKEVVTSELIYYWMIALNIPMDCQKWHLNRLFMLIRITNEKNKPSKNNGKAGKALSASQLSSRRALNQARKKQYRTRG